MLVACLVRCSLDATCFGASRLLLCFFFKQKTAYEWSVTGVQTCALPIPDMGPKLRDADVPQRFEFPDVDLVMNIRAARSGEEGNLHWEWTDDVDWDSKVRMTMDSDTANKYFQGKENVAM